jgi:hypothetical protein
MLKRSVRAILALTIAGAGLTACASAGGSSNGTAARPSSRYLLTAADLGKAKADNLYDAIVKLRPEFLRGHGENTSFVQQNISGGSKDPGSAGLGSNPSAGAAAISSVVPVIAYRDNSRLASVDDLKQILLSQVAEVRYMPGPEASVRFGTNHSGGAIIVTSK